MTTTTSAYLAVSQNLSRYQAMTAAEPAVKSATAYYEANIGSVTSIKDFVDNYRLLSYALDAYGLGDQINNTALITQVLQGGVSNPKSLANTLSNSNWRAFAAAFNFADGGSSASSASAVQTTTSDYAEQQLESDQGAQNGVGVAARALFSAGRADRQQRIRNSRRSESLGGGSDDLRPLAVDQRAEPRHAGERAFPADADLRLERSSEAEAAYRAVHRDVRPDVWAELRRDHAADGHVKQFEFGPIRAPLRFSPASSVRTDQCSAASSTLSLARSLRCFRTPSCRACRSFRWAGERLGQLEERTNGERPAQAARPKVTHASGTSPVLPYASRATTGAAPVNRAPSEPDALYAAAVVLWGERRREEAIRLIDEALRRRPDFADALCMGGYMLSEFGKPEPALRFYRRALELDASLVVAHLNIGKVLFSAGRFAEALRSFEAATALAPDDPDAWSSRAGALRELGRLDGFARSGPNARSPCAPISPRPRSTLAMRS